MTSQDLLDDLLLESEELIGRCLAALGEGELLGGEVIGEIELRYRLIAIVRLLAEADRQGFRDNLHRSGCAALHLFELAGAGGGVEPRHLTAGENPGFADAVIAGDLDLAARLAELSPKQHAEGFEYEDDFLRYHLLHRMLLGADDTELRAILKRWGRVLDGQRSVPRDVGSALVERDSAAFGESILALVDDHVARFESFRSSAGYIPEVDASLGAVLMDGLVVLRFAQLRGITTEREYRFMPHLARLPVGGPFPDRDAWRTPPGERRVAHHLPSAPARTDGETAVGRATRGFFILGPARDDEFCKIDMVAQDFPSMNPARRGRSMVDTWPKDARLKMERRHKGIKVPDVVLNPHRCLMVTDRMKRLLQEHIATPVEYLPFTLVNHKGRVADDAMWVVNLLDSVACVDMEKTDGSESPFYPGEFQDLLELHVLEEKLPSDRAIFRLKECPEVLLVRDDLRRAIEDAHLSAEFLVIGELIY